MSLRAGVAVREVSPWLGDPLTFYGPCRGIADPLELALLVLEQGDRRLAVCALDALGARRAVVDRLRAAVARAARVRPEAVLVHFSHTHYGAQLLEGVCARFGPRADAYARRLEAAVEAAAAEAADALAPATVRRGEGEVRIGINRRRVRDGRAEFAPNPAGPVDPRVTVVELNLHPGRHRVVLFHVACHPTAQVGEGGFASADWPGAARRRIRAAHPDAVPIFLQGCCGDIRPDVRSPDGQRFRYASWAEAQELGRSVGDEVLRVLAADMQPLAPALRAAEVEVQLPLGPPPRLEAVSARARRPDWRDWERAWADQARPEWVPFRLQRLDLAREAVLIGFEGEPVQEYGLGLPERLPGALGLGYSNGLVSYLPTAHMVAEGGYEVEDAVAVFLQPAPFAPAVEEAIWAGVDRLREAAPGSP